MLSGQQAFSFKSDLYLFWQEPLYLSSQKDSRDGNSTVEMPVLGNLRNSSWPVCKEMTCFDVLEEGHFVAWLKDLKQHGRKWRNGHAFKNSRRDIGSLSPSWNRSSQEDKTMNKVFAKEEGLVDKDRLQWLLPAKTLKKTKTCLSQEDKGLKQRRHFDGWTKIHQTFTKVWWVLLKSTRFHSILPRFETRCLRIYSKIEYKRVKTTRFLRVLNPP